MNDNVLTILRFVLLPFGVISAFLIVGLSMREICILLHLWDEPVAGFITAGAVVFSAYAIAPRAKFICACIVFVIGAYVAWHTTSGYYPEWHRKAYQSTVIPFAATLAGGMAVLLATMLYRWMILPTSAQERAAHR